MRYFKRILLVIAVMVIVFVAINWQYFKAQINFYFNRPQVENYSPPDNTSKQEPEKVEANRLWIPSLGVEAPLVYDEEGITGESDFQKALQDGVVHYPNTAMPGKNGNAYYLGHSSDFFTAPGKYKTVFALLPQIELGATIEISDDEGILYHYKVDSKRPVESKELDVLKQDESKKQLTLQTSYPIGTALRRYIVVAYLIE